MSKIQHVNARNDYKLLIEFEDGSTIIFNMQKMVNTLPYLWLNDISNFNTVKFKGKSIYWDAGGEKTEFFPLRLSIDNILFSLRD